MDGFISIYLGQVKKTNVSRSDFCKKERAGAFFVCVFFFVISAFFYYFQLTAFFTRYYPPPGTSWSS